MNLTLQYRKELAEVLKASGKFDQIYFKVGSRLDLSKINVRDSDLPTLVVAFAGGDIQNNAITQNMEDGFTDQNAIYFYIISRDTYLRTIDDDDFSMNNEVLENGRIDLIKVVSRARKFRQRVSQFSFRFLHYEYVEGDDLNDNNFSIAVQYAENKIEIYDDEENL